MHLVTQASCYSIIMELQSPLLPSSFHIFPLNNTLGQKILCIFPYITRACVYTWSISYQIHTALSLVVTTVAYFTDPNGTSLAARAKWKHTIPFNFLFPLSHPNRWWNWVVIQKVTFFPVSAIFFQFYYTKLPPRLRFLWEKEVVYLFSCGWQEVK